MVNESYYGKEQPYNVFNELSHEDLEQNDQSKQSQFMTGEDDKEDYKDIISIHIHGREINPRDLIKQSAQHFV